MDTKTIFVLTPKGEDEVTHKTSLLYGDIKRALSMVDGASTYAEISKRAAPSLRSILGELVKELTTGGFIQDKAKVGFNAKIVAPSKAGAAAGSSELDFTTVMRAPSAEILRAEAAKIQLEQKAKQEAEAEKLRIEQAKQAAEEARRVQEQEAKLKAQQEAKAKEAAELARQKAEAEAKRLAAEKLAREQAEAARLKAEQEARLKAEAEAKAKQEAARIKAEQEAELARRKAEVEAKVRAEAERRAQEETARIKAEQEAERVRKEAELARQKAEAEAKARAEAERRAQEEAARIKAEQEAERVRKEAELARQKAEAEAKARAEAERRAQEEAARIKAEHEAERIRHEAELAKQKAEAEARAREEAERRVQEEAQAQAERIAAQAREEAERIKREAESQARAAEELARKARQEAEEARLKAEAEAKRVRDELEAVRLKAELESRARLEAEAARLAAEKVAAQALVMAEQASLQEREAQRLQEEQRAIQAREEEQKRAKQFALAAASTQVRDTPYDTSKPPESAPAFKLDSINLDALNIKPEPAAAKPKPDESAAYRKQPVPQVASPEAKVPSAEELKAKENELKEQAKRAEAERIAENEAAKRLADAQARAWAEAEQRAAEASRAHAGPITPQPVHAAEVKRQAETKVRVAKVKRKPLPWGGIVTGLLVLALLAVFLVPMFLPMQEYAASVEKMLAEKLQQPVHIGKMSARILPTPRIDLSEIFIGNVNQIKMKQAQLNFGFDALFGDVKRIDKVEVSGGELNGTGLLDVPGWLTKMSGDTKYPITRITFNSAKLNGDAVQLNDLEGEVSFTPEGKFSSSVLRANIGKFVLDIKATPENKLETTFNLRDSTLPLLPNWKFDDLSAKGVLTRDGFTVESFDGRIAGGILQGDAALNWKTGWSAQGSLNAKSITLATLNRLLEGDMDGVAHFKMQADTLAKMPDTVALDGALIAKKGVINGVDVVETARLHSKDNLPGGRTHFDELDSNLVYGNNAYHFKSVRIVNSVLNSTGNIDIVKQQLSGKLSAHLSITEGMGTVDLQVGGATDNPSLRATR